MASDEAKGYFEFLAKLGLTKHLGSMEATRRLLELSHIEGGQRVLDVGCGVGATPVYLAKERGCRVLALDLLVDMVDQARETAKAHGVDDRITFVAADARGLPLVDGLFDAVIVESVNVFFDDKGQAVREYVRATRPGGYVGFTEMTWLDSPDPETAAYYRRVVYADALEADGWIGLLEGAGLEDVVGESRPVDIPREGRGRIERYGCRGMLRVLGRVVRVVFQDRASRKFLQDVTTTLPKDMLGAVGYGVYAGRKPT